MQSDVTSSDPLAREQIVWSEECEELMTIRTAQRIAAMLGVKDVATCKGAMLPFGWHFALLGPALSRSDLRYDGFGGLGPSASRGGDTQLVLVGRQIRQYGPVAVGKEMQRRTVVRAKPSKGDSQVMEVGHELQDGSGLLVRESQAYVIKSLSASIGFQRCESDRAVWQPKISRAVVPDEVLLLQYSSLGFNAHRIHYDQAYATKVAGFPALVVNGGLTTLLLLEFLRSAGIKEPRGMSAKHLRPIFCNREITLGAERTEAGWSAGVINGEGILAAQAVIED